jgi:hypothetical protein
LRSKKSQRALDLQGLDKAPIYSVKLENCTFQNVAKENIVKNVQGLTMRNVVINGKPIGVEAETSELQMTVNQNRPNIQSIA